MTAHCYVKEQEVSPVQSLFVALSQIDLFHIRRQSGLQSSFLTVQCGPHRLVGRQGA